MKLIKLSQDCWTQVDNEDYEELIKYSWYTHKTKNTLYAVRGIRIDNKTTTTKMHRVIMGVTDPKVLVDHIDHNGLNNQRSNLRIATKSQNATNSNIKRKSRSKYVGVYKREKQKNGSYIAICAFENKTYYRYNNSSEIEAALSYNEMALKYHGEFARLNIFETEEEKVECNKILENREKAKVSKKCSYCREYKPFTDFRVESKRKDGLYCSCRKCETMITYKSREKNGKM